MIQTKDLYKIYQTGTTQVGALKGIDLAIDANEFVSIMGPSGSGKSTLMCIIGCLDVPTSESYKLNGQLVSSMEDIELASVRNQEIGFVFQTFHLLPRLNALDNVGLPLVYSGLARRVRRTKAEAVLEAVGLTDRMDHRPNELSGGQRQRVAIARALVNEPSIILADEPTGALDTKTGEEIMDLFNRLHELGNTIVVVTHEEHIAQHSRRIVRFRDGLIESDLENSPRAV